MICGSTRLIAHIGVPTHGFRSPMIYNPYFEQAGIDAIVVPMGCEAAHYPALLRSLFKLTNICGALVTMPHKVTTVALLDDASAAVQIAGACNAVRRDDDGRLLGDLFDGEGFVRGMRRKGCEPAGKRALVVGSGGVGSAIAAALATARVAALSLFDTSPDAAPALAGRLQTHYPLLSVRCDSNDPAGHDIVVNATPLGMNDGDPRPLDMERVARTAFVGEVVMTRETTAFLAAARARLPHAGGHRYAVRTDSRVPGVFWAALDHACAFARGREAGTAMRTPTREARANQADRAGGTVADEFQYL